MEKSNNHSQPQRSHLLTNKDFTITTTTTTTTRATTKTRRTSTTTTTTTTIITTRITKTTKTKKAKSFSKKKSQGLRGNSNFLHHEVMNRPLTIPSAMRLPVDSALAKVAWMCLSGKRLHLIQGVEGASFRKLLESCIYKSLDLIWVGDSLSD